MFKELFPYDHPFSSKSRFKMCARRCWQPFLNPIISKTEARRKKIFSRFLLIFERGITPQRHFHSSLLFNLSFYTFLLFTSSFSRNVYKRPQGSDKSVKYWDNNAPPWRKLRRKTRLPFWRAFLELARPMLRASIEIRILLAGSVGRARDSSGCTSCPLVFIQRHWNASLFSSIFLFFFAALSNGSLDYIISEIQSDTPIVV